MIYKTITALKLYHCLSEKSIMMQYHERKSPRAPWHDYGGGIYFVTIVTHNRLPFLGQVRDNIMCLSLEGMITSENLIAIPTMYQFVELYNHVVMPNHLHLLLGISVDKTPRNARANDIDKDNAFFRDWAGTLSVLIRQIKSRISYQIHSINSRFSWQGRYHDHIVRDERSFNMIHEYITNNPERWKDDIFNNEE
ncbi:MAG: hypothetical protein IJU62_01075 [Muribaculaceae bacterium]|nr:hypothetical protein [Muribaculaceae bacterium]